MLGTLTLTGRSRGSAAPEIYCCVVDQELRTWSTTQQYVRRAPQARASDGIGNQTHYNKWKHYERFRAAGLSG
jgi:hypothetical protein